MAEPGLSTTAGITPDAEAPVTVPSNGGETPTTTWMPPPAQQGRVPPPAVWPYALPPPDIDMFITIVCGHTRCHWSIHEGFQKDYYPVLFWK